MKNEKVGLTIKNFRGIKEGSLKLGKVNILIGGNNSGKTTILESLFLLPNPFRPAPCYLEGRGQLSALEVLSSMHSTLGSEASIFLFHYYNGGIATINFEEKELGEVSLRFDMTKGDEIKVHIEDASITPREFIGLGELRKESPPPRLHSVHPSIIKFRSRIDEAVFFHPSLLGLVCEYLRNRWVNLRASGLTAVVAQKISEAVGAEFDDLLLEPFIGGSQTIYFRDRRGRGVRFGDVGSGSQVFAALALLYEHIKPALLLIDDIESHMNPSLLTYVTSWLADVVKDTKLFVSTHSLEAAKIIAGVLEDYNPIIKLLELREGVLKSKDLTLEEVEELEKAGIDIRQRGILL
ncbi:MAG: AAA family ATPase [Candidatus Bathyarchaeia archaeon]